MDYVRIKMVVAYDGANYAGWQTQKIGVGVQQIIEGALAQLFPGAQPVHSSSRTDTGVHALGMVAHADIPRSEWRIPIRKLVLALNAHLPEDIRVQSVTRAKTGFHARFQARGKQYRYFLWNHAALNPLLRHQSWHVTQSLDLGAMKAAAVHLVGSHDFRSFAANRNYPMPDTVRTLSRCEVRRQGSLFTFIIEGDGFLYKMCRGIVGTLVQVGQGKFAPGDLPGILAGQDRRQAGMTAPAQGLVLWKVYY